MRITRLELRSFRGVEQADIEFGPGITVVEGPNEVGKSSLAEAWRLIREAKCTSRSQRIWDVQPVGRDVGPEVAVEMTTGPYRLRCWKRWLKKPETELRIAEPAPEQLAGEQAHDRFLAILGQTADLDLLDALEVQQGRSLDQADLAGIAALHRTLDQSGEPDAPGPDRLMDLIEREYLDFHTPGGKPTGSYKQSVERVEQARRELDDLTERGQELDGLVDRHARIVARLDRLTTDLGDARTSLDRWTGADRELQVRRDAARQSARALEDAQRDLARAADARTHRQDLVDDVRSRTTGIDGQDQDLVALVESRDRAAGALTTARQQVEVAETQAREAHERSVGAAEAVSRWRDRRDRDDLTTRIGRVRDARERLSRAESQLTAPAVTAETLRELTGLDTEVRVARSTRQSAAARVSVRAIGPQRVTVDGVDVHVGTDHTQAVLDTVHVAVPGVVEVTVAPGSTSSDLDRAVEDAEQALTRRLDQVGAESLDQAAQVADLQAAARAQRDQAVADQTRELGEATLEDLEQRLADITARVSFTVGQAGESPSSPTTEHADAESDGTPTLPELQLAADQGRAAEEQAAEDLAQARQELERARAASTAAHDAAVHAQAQVGAARDQLERLMRTLESAREQTPGEDLTKAVQAATELRDRRRATADADQRAVDQADPETVAVRLENARQQVERAQRERSEAQTEAARTKALIDDRSSTGIESARIEAAARLEEAEDAAARLDRAARSARLLRDTMIRHREQARRRYVAPFTERVERLGRIVFGPDLRIEVTPDLEIATRTSAGRTVAFDQLSAGAREQLALIGRLACAQLVSADQGAPVILDDTLGFSDPDRLAALGAVLSSVGGSAQVIVLTCQPGRFTSVGSARVVRLPGL